MVRKKRVGVLVFSLVFLLFAFPSFAFIPQPPPTPTSCQNSKWDAGEEWTDCGGVCPIPCPPNIPVSCQNGKWDPREEGIDCGGICPAPCPPGTPASQQVPGTCSNGIKDANEDSVDCGAVCNKSCTPSAPPTPGTPTPPPTPATPSSGGGGRGGRNASAYCPPPRCVFNWTVGAWSVCVGGIQTRSITNVGTCPNDCETATFKKPSVSQPCLEPASCFDSIKNQDESDVDCGGICTAQNQKCKIGQTCAGKDTNCFSEYCDPSTGRCTVKPTCWDKILNQGEIQVDCGGPCPACAVAATCNDRIQNQGESGVDCGGPCTQCPSTCTDGIKNGGETDIDCGGPCIAQGKKCALAMSCAVDSDCKEELTCKDSFCSKKYVIEIPGEVKPWWGLFLAFLSSFWWIILLGILLIILAVAGYHYYELHRIPEELPPVPPFKSELPPFPVAAPALAPMEEILPPFTSVMLPTSIEAPEQPLRQRHYRELMLPLYVEKEKYKQIIEDLPLLSSMFLKQGYETFRDLDDIHNHKSADIRRLHDNVQEIYKHLTFMDAFLFELGKKQHKIRFEE